MKKKPDDPGESKSHEGIKLYRDDIELILSIFNENEYTVQITDNEFQFDSLDELIDKRGITPSYFKFDGNNKNNTFESVSVTFEKKRIHIHSFAFSKNNSKIVFARINDICEMRTAKIYKILNPWFYFPVAVLLIVPFISILEKYKESALNMHPWFLSITGLFIAASIFSGLYRYFGHQIILKRKHEGGFWKQNADKIWLLILGALIGVFIKFILEIVWKAI